MANLMIVDTLLPPIEKPKGRARPPQAVVSRMSGFAFPIRRIGGGRKSSLKEKRQADSALKSNEITK